MHLQRSSEPDLAGDDSAATTPRGPSRPGRRRGRRAHLHDHETLPHFVTSVEKGSLFPNRRLSTLSRSPRCRRPATGHDEASLPVPRRRLRLSLVAVALVAGGWFAARRTDPDVRRFGGVLWLLSTEAFAAFLTELLVPQELASDWSLFLIGTGAAVWAGVLATMSSQATTQIGLFGATVVAAVGFPFAHTHGFGDESDVTWLALAFRALAVGWILGGRIGALKPTILADVLGGPSPCTRIRSGRSGRTSATSSACPWCC